MTHSILIIGQSNMAGRGILADAPKLDTNGGKLKVLRNGRWQTMFRPVNFDRLFSGTSLVESFAKEYSLDHPDVDVGVIPCADGGTMLNQWAVGGLLFTNAVNCAKLALRTSHLVAILWHQGESDCAEHLYPHYLEKLTKIMTALRHELGAEDVPIIVGGLGDFIVKYKDDPALENYKKINKSLVTFAKTAHRAAFASAEGLTPNPDNLHFNRESLHEFGLRYYEAFKAVEDKERVFAEIDCTDGKALSKMEKL